MPHLPGNLPKLRPNRQGNALFGRYPDVRIEWRPRLQVWDAIRFKISAPIVLRHTTAERMRTPSLMEAVAFVLGAGPVVLPSRVSPIRRESNMKGWEWERGTGQVWLRKKEDGGPVATVFLGSWGRGMGWYAGRAGSLGGTWEGPFTSRDEAKSAAERMVGYIRSEVELLFT